MKRSLAVLICFFSFAVAADAVADGLNLTALLTLTVAAAVAARRARFFGQHPVAVGLLFGLLSVFAQLLPIAEVGHYELEIPLHLAPVIVAGFFFSPAAGLVSGGIACLGVALCLLDGVSPLLVVCSAIGTLATAAYAVLIGRLVFLDRLPPFCTAAIAAAYGVVVYLSVGSLFGLEDLPTTLEIDLAFFAPMTVGTGLIVGAVVCACGSWRDWWRGFFSSLNLAFLFFGLAVGVTSAVVFLNAREEGEAIVRHAVQDLTAEMESQARYMLHEGAVNLIASMEGAKRPPTREELVRYAEVIDVDGITLADSNGLVTVTTERDLEPRQSLEWKGDAAPLYREMCAGRRPFVCLPFAPLGDGTNVTDYVKRFALPLPRGGVLRLSYLWSGFQFKFPQYIKPTLEGRHIGETGFYLIFDGNGALEVPVPDRPATRGLKTAEIGLDAADMSRPEGTVFTARILGAMCRCVAFEPIGGYRIFAVLPIAETQGSALVIGTVVALVLMVMCVVFRVVLVRFRRAQEKIDALRAAEERRNAADMELARIIQRAELRTDGTEGEGYRIRSFMKAAREVGGDFYDYYELPDGRLVVTIADVSGKGIPAAFFMMKSRMTLKSCVHSAPSLDEAVARANARLSANNPADMFVTAWVGVFDRATGTLDFVSAGHNPPLLLRHPAAVEWLQPPRCPAMGSFACARYRSARVTLKPGDRLFLYTDGVTEAMNGTGELFGNGRLEATLGGALGDRALPPDTGSDGSLRPGALIQAVSRALETFVAGAEQSDDMTMLELDMPRPDGI